MVNDMGYYMTCGIKRVEVRGWRAVVAPYAQHPAAVEVVFVPRGGRVERSFVQTYAPSLVVVDGWGGPEPDGVYDDATTRVSASGASTTRGRYRSSDPRWQSDFDAKLAASGARILADYRRGGPFKR